MREGLQETLEAVVMKPELLVWLETDFLPLAEAVCRRLNSPGKQTSTCLGNRASVVC